MTGKYRLMVSFTLDKPLSLQSWRSRLTSLVEFRKFVLQTERELWQLFQSIDKDHDGHLDKGELRSAFLRAGLAIPNSRLDKFFDDVDVDNDGVISFDEWRYAF